MAPPKRVHNTSLPLPALQHLNRCLNAQSSNLYRSVTKTIPTIMIVGTEARPKQSEPRFRQDCVRHILLPFYSNLQLFSSKLEWYVVSRGNVQLNWPKLFQAFSVNCTLIFFMSVFIQSFHISAYDVNIMHIESKYLLLEHFERDKVTLRSPDLWAIIGWFRYSGK